MHCTDRYFTSSSAAIVISAGGGATYQFCVVYIPSMPFWCFSFRACFLLTHFIRQLSFSVFPAHNILRKQRIKSRRRSSIQSWKPGTLVQVHCCIIVVDQATYLSRKNLVLQGLDFPLLSVACSECDDGIEQFLVANRLVITTASPQVVSRN